MFFCRKDDCANLKEAVFNLEPLRQARVRLHLRIFRHQATLRSWLVRYVDLCNTITGL